jgi:uncharacterized protein (DUF111 family)
VRTYGHIAAMVEEARLPARVRARALATFEALAQAEGRLHRRPPEQVHFHEVGALDAIVDIVGTAAALEVLDVDEVHSSPVANGLGMIRSAHGVLPNPAPAVVELLRGAPTYGVDLSIELTTPTGAALMAASAVSWGPMPAMQIERTGFGAGTRDIDRTSRRWSLVRRSRRCRAVSRSCSWRSTSTTRRARSSRTPLRHCSTPERTMPG